MARGRQLRPIGRVAFLSAVGLWFGTVYGLLGGYTMFHMYEKLPEAKYLMMLLLALLSTVQLLAFLVSLRAAARD